MRLRDKAAAKLEITYGGEPGEKWRISFRHSSGSVTPLSSGMAAEQAKAQLVGMLERFASEQSPRRNLILTFTDWWRERKTNKILVQLERERQRAEKGEK